MKTQEEKNILLLGVPRSGTTWLAKILTANQNITYIHEPDNERHTYSAYYYKRGLPRFPYIRKLNSHTKAYLSLFKHAFKKPYIKDGSRSNEILYRLSSIRRKQVEFDLQKKGVNKNQLWYPEMLLYPFLPKQIKSKGRRLVKSVHATLSTEILIDEFDLHTIIIIRHPSGIISSYLEMKNDDLDRHIYSNKKLMKDVFGMTPPDYSNLTTKEALAGFQIAIFYKMIYQLKQKHPDLTLIRYEDLCADPMAISKNLYQKVHLPWSAAVEDFILSSDKKGEGYKTNRLLQEQKDIWKKRLTPEQIGEIQKGYFLGKPEFYQDFL